MQAVDTHLPHSPSPSTERAATVQLLTGEAHEGKIHRFDPAATELLVEIGSARRRMVCERVATITFAGPSAPLTAATRCKITLTTGTTLTVDTVLEARSRTGFFARLPDAREIFIYDHAVRSKERAQPLGAMLVADGIATAATVSRALEVQGAARKQTIGEILVARRLADPFTIQAAVSAQARKNQRLGDVLVEAGLVRREDIERAVNEQKRRRGRRLGAVLFELGLAKEEQISQTIAKKFCMPFVDLTEIEVNRDALREVPEALIEKHGFYPLDTDERTLTIAISDPLDTSAAEVLRFHTKKRIVEVVVTPSQLRAQVERRAEDVVQDGASREMEDLLEQLGAEQVNHREDPDKERHLSESNSAVIKLTNRIVLDAILRGASDIHIETNGAERSSVVRFRVDGDCVPYQEVPPAYRRSIVARLKIMADLDISERRKPQDGKIRFRLPDQLVELRVATMPTVNDNEDVVLRVLANAKPKPLEKLELSARNLGALREIIARPHGLVLCVGPTGSGKTTTLHSVLGAINTPDMKIWTAEDPVEITQPGLRQVQVNARIGLSFAAAMRSFLRADPDVIMVGEMRDVETASTAIEASLTGHLVFSTLHTNSAPETITRLLDMGLDPFSFGDALMGVLAQRLVRAVCTACREPYRASTSEVEALERLYGGVMPETDLFRGAGCSVCGGTGYKGRVAIHELLVADDAVRRAVTAKAPAEEIRRLAMSGGMTTLGMDGVEKALRGLTDLRQVLGACSR
jgi:type II secretory ATPase GspE/PulE/Tfp pilus assembly ATPase PilB-like protein